MWNVGLGSRWGGAFDTRESTSIHHSFSVGISAWPEALSHPLRQKSRIAAPSGTSPAFPILRRPWRSVRSPFRELARPTACVRADPDMRVHACSVTSSESKIYACPSLPIRRRTLAFLRLRDGLHPRVLETQWTGLETCVLNDRLCSLRVRTPVARIMPAAPQPRNQSSILGSACVWGYERS
ncbi:hypothetical protein K466DRAFT_191979 [Polyporus arcularius HHB13444]|uniref:Uncharacterized protein n=1 Tax=Polyporus arcularius HHB13444 TaxID=1314778 RepID=A0A5C3P9P1_9APHY|nr:hypothetical protein K466DRAFT_191979 [Polyporus arcularius HHB13444]